MNPSEHLKLLESINFLRGGLEINQRVSSLGTSVAIVGNAGKLLKKEQGDLIDNHDVVIRFNHGPTAGYEKHVGSKTTMRSINCHTFNVLLGLTPIEALTKHFPDFNPNYLFELENQIIISKNLWTTGSPKGKEIIERTVSKNNQILFMNDPFVKTCDKLLSNQVGIEATSGFVVTMAACLMFENVSCFGFSFYEEDWDTKHYFEKMIPYTQSDSHEITGEKLLMLKMSDAGIIKIH